MPAATALACPHCQEPLLRASRFCPECRFPVGLVAGRYRLLKKLGSGGFGVVYLARANDGSELRVLKALKPERPQDPELQRRFLREIEITSRLSRQNPRIVRIYEDYGEDPSLGFFYVMEVLQGQNLQQRMASPLSDGCSLSIFAQLCDALVDVHEAGIVHRDLKPSNVFVLQPESPTPAIKVLDFGIAKSLLTGSSSGPSTQGALGTPAYMSPEQCLNQPVDGRSDLYSLGILLYQMLTGCHIFEEEPGALEPSWGMVQAHLMQKPVPLQHHRPDLPEAFCDALMGWLKKRPHQRPASLAEAWSGLRELLPEGLEPQLPESSSLLPPERSPPIDLEGSPQRPSPQPPLPLEPVHPRPTPQPAATFQATLEAREPARDTQQAPPKPLVWNRIAPVGLMLGAVLWFAMCMGPPPETQEGATAPRTAALHSPTGCKPTGPEICNLKDDDCDGDIDEDCALPRLCLPTQKLRAVPQFFPRGYFGLIGSPRGRYLLTVPGAHKPDLWDLSGLKKLAPLDTSKATGHWLAISPNGRWISHNKYYNKGLLVRDLETRQVVFRAPHLPDGGGATFSHDSRLLALSHDRSKSLYLYRTRDWKLLKRWDDLEPNALSSYFRQIQFTRDDRYLMAARGDVFFLSTGSFKVAHRLRRPHHLARFQLLPGHGRALLLRDPLQPQSIHLYHAGTRRLLRTLKVTRGIRQLYALSRSGAWLAQTVSPDSKKVWLQYWQISNNKLLAQAPLPPLEGPTRPLNSMIFGPLEQTMALAYGENKGTLYFYQCPRR